MPPPFDLSDDEKYAASRLEKTHPSGQEDPRPHCPLPSTAPDTAAGVLEEADGRFPNLADQELARQSTKSSYNPGPPPDGGVAALTMCMEFSKLGKRKKMLKS